MTRFSKIRRSLWRNLWCAGLALLGTTSEAQTPWLASEKVGGEARFLYGGQIRRYDLTARSWSSVRSLPRTGATAMTGDASGGRGAA